MEITFVRVADTLARFYLTDSWPAFANSIRREMISGVPTLAIEDVRIYDNTSVLFDEMLVHRLGLIPLKTDLSTHVPKEECSCEGVGCPTCTATYTLSVEGPRTVYSNDLIPQDSTSGPIHENIPIVKLNADQKVVVEAKAHLSTGKNHAKWQATTACGYKNYPVIVIDEQCDGCGMCVDDCPRGVLAAENGKVVVVEGKLEECSLCKLCERACLSASIGAESSIRVNPDPTRFIFTVEGDGSLPVVSVLSTAVENIRKKATDLETILSDVSGRETK
ncbi:MAG: DNA-directed RNA polymerase subunit D [Methanomicrobiales archaeon]|nr:DNA-directed RNA polymerase subunit D [Methanomicrobiales archaeon]MDD1669548.1 DNA-directed RNA polymerase subunit D [Methanomicrobiales archaeon]